MFDIKRYSVNKSVTDAHILIIVMVQASRNSNIRGGGFFINFVLKLVIIFADMNFIYYEILTTLMILIGLNYVDG